MVQRGLVVCDQDHSKESARPKAPRTRAIRHPAMFFAHAAVLQAIHRHKVRQFNPDAKEHHYWGKRKLKRDQ
jgi:hypothetical protein